MRAASSVSGRALPVMDVSSLLFDLDDPPEETRIHRAAYSGELSALRQLPAEERRWEAINRQLLLLGATPLRLAVSGDAPECVDWLLSNGAEVDMTDMKAQTPLFVAVKEQHLECARILLEHGADPNGSCQHLSTPLGQCCQTGWLPGVQLLLEYGADAEISLTRRAALPTLPLYIAAVYHHLDCFLALLMAGCRPDPLRLALPASEHASIPHALLRHRCAAEFGELLYQFGGNLWQRDGQSRRAWEADPSSPTAPAIRSLAGTPQRLKNLSRRTVRECVLFSRTPQRLENLCRLTVREQGTPQRLENLCRLTVRECATRSGQLDLLSLLPLPPAVVRYLQYSDTTSLVKFTTNRFQ